MYLRKDGNTCAHTHASYRYNVTAVISIQVTLVHTHTFVGPCPCGVWLCSMLDVCPQIALCWTLILEGCWKPLSPIWETVTPLPWVLSLSLFLFMLLFYLNNGLLSFSWILVVITSVLSPGIKCSKRDGEKQIHTHIHTHTTISPVPDPNGTPVPHPAPLPWLWSPSPAEPRNWGGHSRAHLQLHPYQFLMPCRLYHPEMRLKPNVWDPNEV